MTDAIGGYFGLELPRKNEEWHKDCIRLNTARNCLEYILRVRGYQRVYIPYYTCEVILEPFRKLGIEYSFYTIDWNLEPKEMPELNAKEAFLYTNYYGLKDDCVERLLERYGDRLIVDCAQAFFSKHAGCDQFYSARKFVGVADGGYLFLSEKMLGQEGDLYKQLPQDSSWERMTHLLKRLDEGAEVGYAGFRAAEDALDNRDMRLMSEATRRILASGDYDEIIRKRQVNFAYLHAHLHSSIINHQSKITSVPLAYPYYVENEAEIRQKLAEARIYTAKYWPNVQNWCHNDSIEYKLANNILPLPIDQRYGVEEMEQIIDTIRK